MKRIKMIIFCILLISMTGCTCKYELEIVNEKYNEKMYVVDNNYTGVDYSEEFNNIYLSYFVNDDLISGAITDSSKNSVTLSKKFNSFEDFNNYSNSVSICYSLNNIYETKDYIYIKTLGEFSCLKSFGDVESFDIVIKSNHKVKENNADEKKGYSYIWHITKDNYKDKPINLVLYKDKKVFNYDNEIFKRILLALSIIGVTILVGVFIKSLSEGKFESKNNRI